MHSKISGSKRMHHLVILIYFVSLASGGPHSHKSKSENKENAEDITSRDSDHYKDGKHNHEFDHEAVLGSHDTAEEFDHLSPEESKRRLQLLAFKMDRDKNSFVDKKELIFWVLRSFRMLTQEEALDQLEEEDGDEDGKVSWTEHAAETYGIYDDDPMNDEAKSEEYQMLQNDRELFQVADSNNDGYLDKAEFASFSHPEEFDHMHVVVYKQAMKKRDINQDGFLSFEEFMADNHGSVPSPTSEHYIMEKDRFVHDFDKNEDGKLDQNEVLLWLIPNNIEMAVSEADHLIESSDENGDGKLSIEEIVDHHEIFVGSEATDFGDHLHNTYKFTDEL